MSVLRILLADGNDDFLEGVAAWLAGVAGVEIVGKSSSGRQAIEMVERLHPDLVLADGTMPELDGFEATRRIKAAADAPLVVLTTFHNSESARNEAWAAGADGFIAKSDVTEGLLDLMSRLVDGQAQGGASAADRRREIDRGQRKNKSTIPGTQRDL